MIFNFEEYSRLDYQIIRVFDGQAPSNSVCAVEMAKKEKYCVISRNEKPIWQDGVLRSYQTIVKELFASPYEEFLLAQDKDWILSGYTLPF